MSESVDTQYKDGVIDYITEIQRPLSKEIVLAQGKIIFNQRGRMNVSEGGQTKQFPVYQCSFLSGESSVPSNLSNPLPGFKIYYFGSADGNFTLFPAYLGGGDFQAIGIHEKHILARRFSLIHEQGHAFLNWKGLSLKLLQAAHSKNPDLLPNFPNIERYYQFIESMPVVETQPYPQAEQDLLKAIRTHKEIKKGVALFEERYSWGVGLALSKLYPGFSDDWLLRDGLEQADVGLLSYADQYNEIAFNHGFSREDSIGNLAYFFEQEFK
ncbi:hypothetical protein KKH13_03145 [Patescibacteria group bacterium]|nr:hypothetical protein [Patescibacteria group bacterium]